MYNKVLLFYLMCIKLFNACLGLFLCSFIYVMRRGSSLLPRLVCCKGVVTFPATPQANPCVWCAPPRQWRVQMPLVRG